MSMTTRARFISVTWCGLPELDAVPFRIGDPCEPTVLVLGAFVIDRNTFRLELGDQRVQIVDAVVEHECRFARSEVRRVLLEQGPNRRAGLIGIVRLSPREDTPATRFHRDAKMLAIPVGERVY